MFGTNLMRIVAFAAIATALTASRGDAAVFATYDADQHNLNGFQFADFDDFSAVDSTGGVLNIDIQADLDSANGLFGGMGSDVVADFDAATTNLDVTLTVGPNNVASAFRISLIDNDGVEPDGTTLIGDEHVYEFDISGLIPGVQTTLSYPLNLGPLFTQGAFGQTPGDAIQNFGLRQMQIQSVFDSPDRLNILVDSVRLEDPEDPLLIEFTSATYAAQAQSFTFGTFQDQASAVDVTGPTMIINSDPAGAGGPIGGFGFNGLNVDFEASDYQLEIEAKLLPTNEVGQFSLLLGDNDGDDSGPGLGSDDYIFTVETSNFNETDFSTVVIPLGTGSENGILTTFGFANGGDGLQNFGLSQMQIQAAVDGDFDGDRDVDGQDFLIVQRGLGVGTTKAEGDANGDGVVDDDDLTSWEDSFSLPAGVLGIEIARMSIVERPVVESVSAVPEPASCILLLCAAGLIPVRRMSRR